MLATTQAEERAFGTIFILIGALLVLPSCFLLQPWEWFGKGGRARAARARGKYYEEFDDL